MIAWVIYYFINIGSLSSFTLTIVASSFAGLFIGLSTGILLSYFIFKRRGWEKPKVIVELEEMY
ncbi:hypothetical protein [Mucilaginibacter sp.]